MSNTKQATETTLGDWATSDSLPAAVDCSQAIVTKNRVYLLGGNINGSPSATVYTAPINPDGTLGAWTTGASLPGPVDASQAIVTQNRVYLLGGYKGHGGGGTNDVLTAPINLDGTLGDWTTGTSLPDTVAFSQAIVTKNRVYLLGGTINGEYSATVYTAPINPDGTLGTWTTSASLPAPVAYSQAIVTKTQVYLLGGYTGSGHSSTVHTAPINPDGTLGAWTTSASLPSTVYHSQAIVTKNQVYLLGGYNPIGYSATVYTAPINPDGTLGDWTTSASLPATVFGSQAIVTKTQVYLLGGKINYTSSSTVYTATIEENTVSSPPPKEITMSKSTEDNSVLLTFAGCNRILTHVEGFLHYTPETQEVRFPHMVTTKGIDLSYLNVVLTEKSSVTTMSELRVLILLQELNSHYIFGSFSELEKEFFNRYCFSDQVLIFKDTENYLLTYQQGSYYGKSVFSTLVNIYTPQNSKISSGNDLPNNSKIRDFKLLFESVSVGFDGQEIQVPVRCLNVLTDVLRQNPITGELSVNRGHRFADKSVTIVDVNSAKEEMTLRLAPR